MSLACWAICILRGDFYDFDRKAITDQKVQIPRSLFPIDPILLRELGIDMSEQIEVREREKELTRGIRHLDIQMLPSYKWTSSGLVVSSWKMRLIKVRTA